MFYITSLEEFCASNKIDDAKRDAGLTTPESIQRFDDIRYGDDERNVLDVYRPKASAGRLPVIVSIHGGGWVYGDKGINQFYCMSLAEQGFAVVNYSYRLAPKHKHPVPLEDANKVFHWVLENAETYGFDTDNVFGVGDSCGANILGFYCCLCVDPAYADKMDIHPPKGFVPRAVALNSGLYRLVRGEELLLDSLAEAYFPGGGTDAEYAEIDLGAHVTAAFPPCFVMTALGDFLVPQAKPFYERLRSLGVPAEYRCYGEEGNELRHVFHIGIKLPEARACNEEECAYFLNQVKHSD
jgi:acetyl esterase/lipase